MVMRNDSNIAQEIKKIINNTANKKQNKKQKKNKERSISVRRHIHVNDPIDVAIR